jgi:hypothetical protein
LIDETGQRAPYLILMANRGLSAAIKQDASLAPGVNTYAGRSLAPRLGPGASGHALPETARLTDYSTLNRMCSTGWRLSIWPNTP